MCVPAGGDACDGNHSVCFRLFASWTVTLNRLGPLLVAFRLLFPRRSLLPVLPSAKCRNQKQDNRRLRTLK
jgi:hypothetical protein